MYLIGCMVMAVSNEVGVVSSSFFVHSTIFEGLTNDHDALIISNKAGYVREKIKEWLVHSNTHLTNRLLVDLVAS